MNDVEKLVEATYLGNTLWQWTVASSVAVGMSSCPASTAARPACRSTH